MAPAAERLGGNRRPFAPSLQSFESQSQPNLLADSNLSQQFLRLQAGLPPDPAANVSEAACSRRPVITVAVALELEGSSRSALGTQSQEV
jgi:hypothetical protein